MFLLGHCSPAGPAHLPDPNRPQQEKKLLLNSDIQAGPTSAIGQTAAQNFLVRAPAGCLVLHAVLTTLLLKKLRPRLASIGA